MSRRLSLTDLSRSTVSRSRGKEAYRKLLDYLSSAEFLDIDLRDQEMISISFLDELVINLKAAHLLDRVIFIFSASDIYRRFTQIAAIRNAHIRYKCSENDEPRLVESGPVPELELKKAKGAAR